MNNRKKQVIRIAQKLFIEKGFPQTSVQDILTEANISKGTFYNYFESKNDCLVAILQASYDEAVLLRNELLTEHNKKDKKVFAEQVALRLLINRNQNLLPLYEAVFYSGDRELMVFIEAHFKEELVWIASRFTDLYGEPIRPVAPDLAILFTGMMQQYLHFSRPSFHLTIEPTDLIAYVLKMITYIVQQISVTEDAFMGNEIFKRFQIKTEHENVEVEELIQSIEKFIQTYDLQEQQLEMVTFILDELQQQSLRVTLLNTVLKAFRSSFQHTKNERAANDLTTMIWKYIHQVQADH